MLTKGWPPLDEADRAARMTFARSTTDAPFSVDPPDDPVDPPSEPPPVNDVPQVALTAPADGSSIAAGAALTLRATVTDADPIEKVEFYVGNSLVGTDSSGADGYTAQWTAADIGWQQLTARAYDSKGAVGTSSSIRVRVRRK